MMTPEPNHRATPQDRWAATADLSWMLWTAIGIGGIWTAVLRGDADGAGGCGRHRVPRRAGGR
jgi:hypothetical protein